MKQPAEYDLFIDKLHYVFAINTKIDKNKLFCGGLYVEPNTPFEVIRLQNNSGVMLDVRLPNECLNQSQPSKAWDISLDINDGPFYSE